MRPRVGLGIGQGEVRGVLVRRGKIVWRQTRAIDEEHGLRGAIEQVLRSMPRQFGRRRQVIAAVGPGWAQLKSLSAIPAANDRLLADAVAANVGRFFLRNGVPLHVTGVRREAADTAWVAAIEAPVIRAIEDACSSARVGYAGALPTLAVLFHAVRAVEPSQAINWRDNDVVGEAVIGKHRLVRAVRLAADESHAAPCDSPPLVDTLAALNGSGWAFADAFAATVANRRDPLLLRPTTDAARYRRHAVWRRGALLILVGVLGLAALFAPGVLASRARMEAAGALAGLATRQREVLATQQTLMQLTRALQRGAAFADERPAMARLLASITQVMPATTALLNLRVDSAGGNLLALSPHGAEVFAAISQIPGLGRAQITAPLTRETIEGVELERVSIRFQILHSRKPAMRGATSDSTE